MEIRLRPEIEALIRQDLQRGPYHSVDEYIEDAVSILHEREAWLSRNREEIGVQIEQGYKAAQRGDLLNPDEVRAKLRELKQARAGDQ
jgi:antitoxin ParD1/3/4